MTDCVVYIGDLDDPKFKWEGGDWNGNTPKGLSLEFPPPPNHYNADFHAWVKSAGVECRQTDFGAWVAKVTKAQVTEYLTKTYAGKEDLPWVKDGLKKLHGFVETLDERQTYALVATEW